MRWKPTWKEWIVIVAVSPVLVVAFLLFFPINVHPTRATPLVGLHHLQRMAGEAFAMGHPMTVSDVKEAMRNLDPLYWKADLGYDHEVLGNGQDWVVVMGKRERRSRWSQIFLRPDLLDIETCVLSAHNPFAIVVDATGRTNVIDFSTTK